VVVRLFALLLVCACLPQLRGTCESDVDCAGGPAGSFCAEGVCQGPPRGTVETLPGGVFARSASVHVRARVDRSHGEPTARVLLGAGSVPAAREADGAFGAQVPLSLAPAGSEGTVPFAVEIKDDLGHATMLASSVVVDDRAPRVAVDAVAGTVLRGNTVAVRAVVQDLTPVTVFWTAGSAQAAAQQQADGSFVAQVDTKSAPPGTSVLDVAFTATDAVGNASTAHGSVALTRLKFSAAHRAQVSWLAISDVIWAMAITDVLIFKRDGTLLTKATTGGRAFAEIATDGSHLFFSRALDDQVCRMGSDGLIQLCCGPFSNLTGGPALLGATPIVATTGGFTTSSRLFAVVDDGGFCNPHGSLQTADFAENRPGIASTGIIYSGAAQSIVAAKFDGIAWTTRATSETSRYRGQPAFRGQLVLSSTTSATIDTFAFVDPLGAPASSPSSVQAAPFGTVVTSPTIAADGTTTVATDDRRVIALRPDGTVRWTATLAGNATAPPTHGAGNLVYVGTLSGEILALSLNDGSTVWSYPAGAPVRGPLAPGCDGLLYAGTDAAVLALVIDAPGLADSSWPRAGHDIRGSGDARRPLRSATGACLE
jgi:hypothetical protein